MICLLLMLYHTIVLRVAWIIFPGPSLKTAVQSGIKHTYLAQRIPWSMRRFLQCEALPLHSGWADRCDHPKCGWLGCAIFVSGGLRSRYPLIINMYQTWLASNICMVCAYICVLIVYCLWKGMSKLIITLWLTSGIDPSNLFSINTLKTAWKSVKYWRN